MNEIAKFLIEVDDNMSEMAKDESLKKQSLDWVNSIVPHKYVYNFSWMGRPIIQLPQDIMAVQELIWAVKPDLVIETGIAHGGSLIMSASMLALLDYCDAIESGVVLDPLKPARKVLGVDIDIRAHNRQAINQHPMSNRIKMLEGSSIDEKIVAEVGNYAKEFKTVMVFLDSNHTHDHVLAELESYAPLTSVGSYCVVFDTVIEDLKSEYNDEKPWSHGDNAKTAVYEFLNPKVSNDSGTVSSNIKFKIDKKIETKLLLTVAPDGFLKRIS